MREHNSGCHVNGPVTFKGELCLKHKLSMFCALSQN